MPSVVPLRPGWRRHAPMAVYALALSVLALALARPEATVAVPDGRAVGDAGHRHVGLDAGRRRRAHRGSARRAGRRAASSTRVPDEVRVGSVVFNDRIRGVRAPTLERAEVRDEIEGLRAAGGTAAGDAVATVGALDRAGARARGAARGARPPRSCCSPTASPPRAGPRCGGARGSPQGLPRLHGGARHRRGRDRGPDAAGARDDAASRPTARRCGEWPRWAGGRFFAAGDDAELDAVYEELGDSLGTRDEKREITAGFAAGAVLLLGAGGLMSLRWLGRLP